jgi:hypothetical protein
MSKKRNKGFSNSTLDKLWSKRVKEKANYKCEICGDKGVEAHHLIPRSSYNTRWYGPNGACLCSECHQKNVWSAHKNPVYFFHCILLLRGEDWYNSLIQESLYDWRDKLNRIKKELQDEPNRK